MTGVSYMIPFVAAGGILAKELSTAGFDVVVSCEVIEHLSEPEKMLREATRVLKEGGKLVVTTPYRLTETPQDPHHAHEFYPRELKSLLEKHFVAVEYILTHHLFWRSLYTYGVRIAGGRVRFLGATGDRGADRAGGGRAVAPACNRLRATVRPQVGIAGVRCTRCLSRGASSTAAVERPSYELTHRATSAVAAVRVVCWRRRHGRPHRRSSEPINQHM